MITITDATAKQVKYLLEEEEPNTGLRIFVQGGGCSGMSYGFTFETSQEDDDFVIEQEGVKFLVDSMSMQYLTGAEIDFVVDFAGANFVIKNPNAQTSCGCGSSFSV